MTSVGSPSIPQVTTPQAAADPFGISVSLSRLFGIREGKWTRYLGLEADAHEYAYLHPAWRKSCLIERHETGWRDEVASLFYPGHSEVSGLVSDDLQIIAILST